MKLVGKTARTLKAEIETDEIMSSLKNRVLMGAVQTHRKGFGFDQLGSERLQICYEANADFSLATSANQVKQKEDNFT